MELDFVVVIERRSGNRRRKMPGGTREVAESCVDSLNMEYNIQLVHYLQEIGHLVLCMELFEL